MKRNITLLLLLVLAVTFNVTADDCFKPLDAALNLAPDPGFDDITKMGGWGDAKGITSHPDTAYCGSSGYVDTDVNASYDQNFLWEANTAYRVRAMLYALNTEFKIGAHGIGTGDVVRKPTELGRWEQIDFVFITGESPSTTLTSSGVHFNATQGFFDNLEVYKWSLAAGELETALAEAKGIYREDGNDAAGLKALMDAAEVLLAGLLPGNQAGFEAELLALTENIKAAIYTYKNDNPDAEGFKDINDREDIKALNLSFEFTNKLENWENNGFQTQTNNSFPLKAGNTYCEKWTSVGSRPIAHATVFQTANVPNGVYKLTVAAQALYQDDTNQECPGVIFVANDVPVTILLPSDYSVTTRVVDGTIRFGMNIGDTEANYIAFDNIRFGFREFSAREALEVLNGLYDEVMIFIDESNKNVYSNDLEEELVAVEEKLEEINGGSQPSLEDINEVLTELGLVFNKIKTSAAAYRNLLTLIEEANSLYHPSEPAADVLKDKIDAAEAMHSAKEADEKELAKMAEDLNYAILRYKTASVSESFPLEVTEWLTNPSFEDGMNGWTNNGFKTQNNTSFALKDGTYYCEQWVAGGSKLGNLDIHQINQVPNGTYTISFAGHSTQNGAASTGGYCYGNGTDFEFGDADSYSFDVTVTNKALKLGIKTVSTGSNWVAFDNFTLVYKGYDANVVANSLQALVDQIKEYSGSTMKSDIQSQLSTGITLAESALASKKEEDMDSAAENLTALLPLVIESVEAYSTLNDALGKANSIKETGTVELGALNSAINAAQAVYSGKTADVAEVNEAVELLNAAIDAFNKLNPSKDFPYDVTADYLINADFETEVKTGEDHTPQMGWEYISEKTFSWASNKNFSLNNGSRFLESWIPTDSLINKGGVLPYLEMVQTVENLPAGRYHITVAAQSIIQNDPVEPGSGFVIYVGDQQVEAGLAETHKFEDIVITEGGTITIGFKTADPRANWISIDNFRLFSEGIETGIETIAKGVPFYAYLEGNQLNVKFNTNSESRVEVAVYNTQGILLAQKKGTYGAGSNVVTMDTKLGSGVYLVRLTCDGENFVRKIVK